MRVAVVVACVAVATWLGVCVGAPSATKPPSSTSEGVAFHRIRSCTECVERGWGWCPIRRACGGFANRECLGDNDERDFARPRVSPVSDRDVGELPFNAVYRHRLVLLYDSDVTPPSVMTVFEDVAIDTEQAGGGTGPLFLSADTKLNPSLASLAVPAPSNTATGLPQAVLLRKAKAGERGEVNVEVEVDPVASLTPDATFFGPWSVPALHAFVQAHATGRIAELDLRVATFVESLLQVLTGQDEAGGAAAELGLILDDVAAFRGACAEPLRDNVAVYLDAMRRMADDPHAAMAWLADRVNLLAGTGVASDELDILGAFTSELLG